LRKLFEDLLACDLQCQCLINCQKITPIVKGPAILINHINHQYTDGAVEIGVSLVKHCLQKGDAKLALQHCHELLANNSQHVQLLSFAALASRSLGWLDDALEFINRAVTVAPSQPTLYCLLGDILLMQKRPGDALTELFKARHLGDESAQLKFNIGTAYLGLAAYEDAKVYFDRTLALDPQMVAAHVNKGLAEHSLMNLDAALDCFDAALCVDPSNVDAQWNKSHVLLTLGKYEQGFRLYETRWRHPQVALKRRRFDSKLWLGHENLSGKTILLYAEGGFGDTIQFIRYAKLFDPDVKLIIQCQKQLTHLVRSMGLEAKVITPGEMLPPHDFNCPLMSLPLAFKTTVDRIPSFASYLKAPDVSVQLWQSTIEALRGRKVGIVARGSSSFGNDQNRSVGLPTLVKYLPHSFNYVLLQQNVSSEERAIISACDNIIAPAESLRSFSDTAALCEGMDLILSVDTAVAHLGAALGKQTIILIANRPDWRWGCSGDKTPWYPSVSLLRQMGHAGWNETLMRSLPHYLDPIKLSQI
jgi:tetratricopeptide (TPR) repeat protein